MNILDKMICYLSKELVKKEIDSEEFRKQSEKCQVLFEELCSTLSEEQKKKLLNLDLEYFMKAGQWKDDGYKEGLESGFKLAIQLVLDSLRN